MSKIKTYLSSVKKGSILAYSLIVITVMLAIVGSLSVAAILQNKSAGSSEFSAQSLQTADSGAQAAIKKALSSSSSAISSLGTCDATTGVVTNSVAGGGAYSLTFFTNADGTGPVSDCSTTLANVRSIKSVGTYHNTARAIQVAVAGTAPYSLPTTISSVQTAATLYNAINTCKTMSGGNWRLPTFEELALFVNPSGSAGAFWTTTPAVAGSNYLLNIQTGNPGSTSITISSSFVCVKSDTGASAYSLPTAMSSLQSAVSLGNAIKNCANMSPAGAWRLPSVDEFSLFINSANPNSEIWTRTMAGNGQVYTYFANTGYANITSSSNSKNYICVQ